MSTAVIAIVAAMNSVMQPIDGDHQQRLGRENRIHAAHEEHARRDHRRRVHERRNRRRAFHRVGQPRVERELGTLADAAAEHADARDEQQPMAPRRRRVRRATGSTTALIAAAGSLGDAHHGGRHLFPRLEGDHARRSARV